MKRAVTVLVFSSTALLALGMVMLYSSSMARYGAHYLLMQLAWCALGAVLGTAAACMDYSLLRKVAWPLLAVSVVMLLLVWIPPIGIEAKGAHRWIGYGGVRFQSSELAKLALIIAIAAYADHNQRQMRTFHRGLLVPALFIIPVLALIFPEPDRGTTILLIALSGTLLLVAGVRWLYVIPLLLMAAAGLVYSIIHDPMRIRRVMSWLNLEETKSLAGYQAYQAMLALGAGGWTGLGLGNGRQKLGFIPEHHTDFILSVIGEELGAASTLLVVAAFVALVISGLCIAWRARDTFGVMLGAGISFLIGFQAFINIGVVTSALPNKGLPLPFISYGGSNLVLMLTCVGLLLSIARHARSQEPSSEVPSGADI